MFIIYRSKSNSPNTGYNNMTYSYRNNCRVCLVDKAQHQIFEDMATNESIHSKFFLCFKEKIKDVEGYPQKICESCKCILDVVHDFISKYKSSSKLLESGLMVVKKRYHETEIKTEVLEDDYLLICKSEPDTDTDYVEIEALDDFWLTIPQAIHEPKKVKEPNNTNVTQLRAKLKGLKEISFKKKPLKKSKTCSNRRKVATTVLEANINENRKRLTSNKIRPKELKIKVIQPEPDRVPSTLPKTLYVCDICGETLKTDDSLQRHMNVNHFGKPEMCPHCSKLFKCNIFLKRHLRNVHGEKRFICDHCSNCFAKKHLLCHHIKHVHLKLRPKRYPCNKCGKDFIAKKHVLIHDRAVHTGIRPVQCNICGNDFLHEDYLKEHMRLHTGETPFKCPICGRGYAQRGNMISHISHNHRLVDLTEEQIKALRPSWFKYLKKA